MVKNKRSNFQGIKIDIIECFQWPTSLINLKYKLHNLSHEKMKIKKLNI